jgi:hypothetical protein
MWRRLVTEILLPRQRLKRLGVPSMYCGVSRITVSSLARVTFSFFFSSSIFMLAFQKIKSAFKIYYP